ncbi:Up-regulated during septation-domain-containing protein [Xylariaceae sp. FL0255]|nr:Up-regulated during septation-domain-containing protein [Xylariaceae sp. FL0255]
MDRYATATPDGLGALSRPAFAPKSSALVDSYSQDAINGFAKDKPRTNPLNPERIQSSVYVDLKDSVQVHLLTETALFDSKEYVILSEDEVDNIRKQCQSLNQRIEQTRSNLVIQLKYRDAAASMSRLYSPTGNRRKSILGNRASGGSEAAREAEAERDAVQRKCETLAAELWSLERCLMEPQKRLLEHTAGILQHAHKTAKKATGRPNMVNGAPASPESMYTTSNGRNSLDFLDDGFVFDEASLYRSFDMAEIQALNSQPKQAPMEIPLKSPVREQNKQLVEESERLRLENEALLAEIDELRRQGSEHWGIITQTEERLGRLNNQLREIIVKADPARNGNYDYAPSGQHEPGDMLDSHLEYLETGIYMIDDSVASGAQEQSEPVLRDLWSTIQSGYADIRQRKQERRKARSEKGLEPDEEDMSDGESMDLDEEYSLNAFSSRIQWMYSQATKLNEQKSVLKRQIKQQRDLNSKSDSEKDQQLQSKADELEQAQDDLVKAQAETEAVRAQLSQAFEDLENLQSGRNEEASAIDEAREHLKQRNAKISALESDTADMRARLTTAEADVETITAELGEAKDAHDAAVQEIEEKQKIIKAKEQELETMTGLYAELKMEATMVKAELDGAYGSRKERAAEVAALHNTSESQKLQTRLETLEQELESTANELTDMVKQSLESEKKIGELESELDSVKSERDRIKSKQERSNEDLQARLQDATSHIEERMESELARLRKEKEQIQDELDKERFKGGTASPSGASRTSHLTDSYRVGLRAERKKYEEQLRVEQMQRRKLEDELRVLKRAQGPGKSPLSPRP